MYPQKMMVLLIEQLWNFGKMLKRLTRGKRERKREGGREKHKTEEGLISSMSHN